MRKSKPPLTIKKQILNIKNKNITIIDEKKCATFLKRNNYQKLFIFKNFFNPNSLTFENLVDIYNLDIEIRNIVFYTLGIIETKLKTEIAYYHSLKYGNHGYLNSDYFINKNYHSSFVKEILDDLNKKKIDMINNHFKNYDDDPPLYKMVEVFSFGQISKFYSNMLNKDERKISKEYYNGIDILVLRSWFKFLVEIRNSCAHGSPFLTKNISSNPKKLKDELWDSVQNRDIEIFFLVVKNLIDDSKEFNKIKLNLIQCLDSASNLQTHPKLSSILNLLKKL